jgi:hypothetical protein
MDRIEPETTDGGARPEQSRDGESRGGAITGERESSIPSTIQRKENTGRESGARRAHLARKRSRGRTKGDAQLGMVAARAAARGNRALEHRNDCNKNEMGAVGLGMRLI